MDRSDSSVLWLGTSVRGLFRSTDAGSTWQSRNSGLTAISISGVSIDPRDSDVVYAGAKYKTIDGGSSWIELCTTGPRLCSWASTGLLGAPLHMIIDPAYPDTLYLPIREAVIKSHDGGINWSLVGAGLPKLRAPWLVGSPVQSGVLYASAGSLFKSTDGGLNFSPADVILFASHYHLRHCRRLARPESRLCRVLRRSPDEHERRSKLGPGGPGVDRGMGTS
ncbi:MAG: hypothetical protein EHM23_24105 [Acidobacteria bacterium]|nr:MAG: hypothetical protein EHM23_24105 [Acidobacteriota bacterium]